MEAPCLPRNSSEEIILGSFMEGSGLAPVTDAISFLAPTEPSRIDSEELFNNWLTNLEASGFPPLWGEHRAPQLSRRMSHEFVALYGKHAPPQSPNIHGDTSSAKTPDANVRESHIGNSRDQAPSKNFPVQDPVSWQMIDWFQQPHPMTRSRSSELHREYLAVQDHTSPAMADSLQRFATHGSQALKRSLGAFTRALASKRPNLRSSASRQSPSSPSSPQFSQKNGDSVSAVVNMLKGTIERKKLVATQRQIDTTVSPTYMGASGQPKEYPQNRTQNLHQRIFQKRESRLQEQNTKDQFQAGIVTPHASSPSDSSGNAPGLSTGAATTEEPHNSNHTVSTHNNSTECSGQNNWAVDETFQQNNLPSPTSDGTSNGEESVLNIDNKKCVTLAYQREFAYIENWLLKKNQEDLVLYLYWACSCLGRYTWTKNLNFSAIDLLYHLFSGFNADAEDLTKKRRVERKRMMTEAKGRSYVPAMPTDLQAVVKRCDALEKESLKLNLSFMNRKDSEQTKRIEDLEKQNQGLLAENNGLLEVLKRVTSGKSFGGNV